MSAVQALCKLFEFLPHSETNRVVFEGARSLDDELVPLLLNYFPLLQFHRNLT